MIANHRVASSDLVDLGTQAVALVPVVMTNSRSRSSQLCGGPAPAGEEEAV